MSLGRVILRLISKTTCQKKMKLMMYIRHYLKLFQKVFQLPKIKIDGFRAASRIVDHGGISCALSHTNIAYTMCFASKTEIGTRPHTILRISLVSVKQVWSPREIVADSGGCEDVFAIDFVVKGYQ